MTDNDQTADPTRFEMQFQATRFFTSVQKRNQLPPDEVREVALAGRSNAGKSSGLNALTRQKQLARISKTPGRTQMINYFKVAESQFLVDLPGYGYAKVPEAVRRHWQALLQHYLNHRHSLQGLLIFMDIRHPLTSLDCQLLDWTLARELPVHCLLTKADKLKRGPAQAALRSANQSLKERYPQASAQLFSATNRLGVDQARMTIARWLSRD